MTSDKAQASAAQRRLNLALGKEKVSLRGLKPREFDDFLTSVLRKIDLRELRGFKPLADQLCRNSSGDANDPTANVSISSGVRICKAYFLNSNTHVLRVSRGALSQTIDYRNDESGEVTTDWRKAKSWMNGGHIYRTETAILFIRRPSDHTRADENLFVVSYVCEKVPFRPRMEVVLINIIPVPIVGGKFRAQFAGSYTHVAKNLILEMSDHASRTLDVLSAKVESFRPVVTELEHINEAISY